MFGMLEAMYQLLNARLKGLYKWDVKTEKHEAAPVDNLPAGENELLNIAGSGWLTRLEMTFNSDTTTSVTWRLYIDGETTPLAEDTLENISSQVDLEFSPLLIRYRDGFRVTVEPSASDQVSARVEALVLKDV